MKKEKSILCETNFKKLEKKDIANIWFHYPLNQKRIENVPKEAIKYSPRKYWCYIHSETGEVKFNVDEDDNNFIITTDYNWFWPRVNYMEYNEEWDAVLFYDYTMQMTDSRYDVYVKYDSKTNKHYVEVDQKKTKKERSLYVLFKNKHVYARNSDKYYYWRREGRKGEVMLLDKKSMNYFPIDELAVNTIVLSKLFGVGHLGGNSYTNFEDITHFRKFLSTVNMEKKDTPKQRQVDEFIKIPLDDFEYKFDKNDECKLICLGDRVNDEYAVLRYFVADYNYDAYEVSRLYVSKKEHIFCRKNNTGEYLYLKNKLKAEHFVAKDIVLRNPDVFNGTKLEYFKDIYTDVDVSNRGAALYTMIMYPEMERFWKMGLAEFCKGYFDKNMSWTSYVKEYFGPINPNEKNINKLLGFNKHQFEKIQASKLHTGNSGYAGSIMKKILNTTNCCDIDDKTFDTILNYVENDKNRYYWSSPRVEAAVETVNTYSVKVLINMIPTLEKLGEEKINPSIGYYAYYTTVVSYYTDYVRTVRLMERASDMRPHFDRVEDIKRMHDDASVVYNMQKDRYENEKFIKRSDFWKKWEYNENEKYVVIAPKLPADLAAEGITLHHCVKSYIERVANGVTNIVFIREKDKIKDPFFTVEISNGGSIEQVHGFCNRNADTEPGLEDFVKEWAKEKKLKTTNFNKVR